MTSRFVLAGAFGHHHVGDENALDIQLPLDDDIAAGLKQAGDHAVILDGQIDHSRP